MLAVGTYTMKYFLFALALGCACLKARRFSHLGIWVRFLAGVSLTPLLLAFMSYLLGLLFPGAPIWLFITFPFVLAAVILFTKNRYLGLSFLFRSAIDGWEALRQNTKQFRFFTIVLLLLLCCLAFLLVIKTSYCIINPVFGEDLSHYLIQAKYFVEDRVSLGIDNYVGTSREGTVLTDDHGPLWPIYLADAWMHSGSVVGYWNDAAMKTACVFSLFAMLAAVAALALAVKYTLFMGLITPAFVLLYRYFYLIPYGSRDGFRLTGLCLLILLLLVFVQRIAKEQAFYPSDYFLLALMCFLTMQGHGSNVYMIFCLSMTFGVLLIICCAKVSTILLMAGATILGTGLVLIKNIQLYLHRGIFRSYTSYATQGTALLDASKRQTEEMESFKVIWGSFQWQEFALSILGVCGLVLIGIRYWRRERRPLKQTDCSDLAAFSFGLFTAALLLPISGLLDWGQYNISTWLLMQIRYRMYLYVVAAVCGCFFICDICDRFERDTLRKGFCYALILLLVTTSLVQVFQSWPNYNAYPNVNTLIEAASFAERSAEDGNIFVSDTISAYYYVNSPHLIVHEYTRPLLVAKTDSEIEAALRRLDAKVFMFSFLEVGGMKEMPFYRYLQEEAHAGHFVFGKPPYLCNVYVIKD